MSKITYEVALTEINGIISEIETGESDVETMIEKVKRATFLLKFCKEKLKKTQEELDKVFKIDN